MGPFKALPLRFWNQKNCFFISNFLSLILFVVQNCDINLKYSFEAISFSAVLQGVWVHFFLLEVPSQYAFIVQNLLLEVVLLVVVVPAATTSTTSSEEYVRRIIVMSPTPNKNRIGCCPPSRTFIVARKFQLRIDHINHTRTSIILALLLGNFNYTSTTYS